MKLSFLQNIKVNEILAKDILDGEGNILLKSGTKLSKSNIHTLRSYNIFLVYIEDNNLSDIHHDKHFSKLKQNTLQKLPKVFDQLVTSDYVSCYDSLNTVEHMIDYIIDEGNINTNLYEVNSYDNYTYIHSVDTSIMSVLLGLSLGLDKKNLKDLGTSAILHDIGKTKIPNSIINKKGPLTEEEFKEIKKHPIYGKEILSKTLLIPTNIINGVAHHHEKVNGTGYPYGLKNDNISEFGKIISICDVFTAVSANRSYRHRFNPNEAYELILSGSGTCFDEELVSTFRKTFSIYPLGSCIKLSNGVEGYVVKQNSNFPDRPIIRVTYDFLSKEPISPYEINLLDSLNITITSIVS